MLRLPVGDENFASIRNNKDLQQAAKEALRQIKDRQYATELRARGCKQILSLGLAFHGKEVAVLKE